MKNNPGGNGNVDETLFWMVHYDVLEVHRIFNVLNKWSILTIIRLLSAAWQCLFLTWWQTVCIDYCGIQNCRFDGTISTITSLQIQVKKASKSSGVTSFSKTKSEAFLLATSYISGGTSLQCFKKKKFAMLLLLFTLTLLTLQNYLYRYYLSFSSWSFFPPLKSLTDVSKVF